VVALSVKSDLMAATIARRRRLGGVRVFDPADVTVEPSTSWSPLREAQTLGGARRAARSIANATDWTGRSGEMGFWVPRPRTCWRCCSGPPPAPACRWPPRWPE